MKTKLKHISRRTIAMILCILMMFSTLMVGTITTANALDATTTPVKNGYCRIFVTNNDNKGNGLKGVYTFDSSKPDSNDDWDNLEAFNYLGKNDMSQDVYYCDIPDDCSFIIRYNDGSQTVNLPDNNGGDNFSLINGLGLYTGNKHNSGTDNGKYWMKTWTATNYLLPDATGTKITNSDIKSILKGEKVMFYYGDSWGRDTKFLRTSSSTGDTVDYGSPSVLKSSYYTDSNPNQATGNFYSRVACVESKKYYISNSSGWGGEPMKESAAAGKAYILNNDGGSNNVKTGMDRSGATMSDTSYSIKKGTVDSGVSATLTYAKSVINYDNTLEYYYTSNNTDFYIFNPDDVSSLAEGVYTIYAVTYDGHIRVRSASATLTVTAPLPNVAESVSINPSNSTIYVGDTVTLTAYVHTPATATTKTYTFKQGNSIVQEETNDKYTFTPTAAGTYKFSVTVSADGYQSVSSTADATVTVKERPTFFLNGRFRVKDANGSETTMGWNKYDTNTPANDAFVFEHQSGGRYKLETGCTIKELSAKIDQGGNDFQYFYIKKKGGSAYYTSDVISRTPEDKKVKLSAVAGDGNSMVFNGTENTAVVTLWLDASDENNIYFWYTIPEEEKYDVTVSADQGNVTVPDVTPAPSVTTKVGNRTPVSIKADEWVGNYKFKKWEASSDKITIENATSTSTTIKATGAGTVTAKYEETYTVTVNKGEGVDSFTTDPDPLTKIESGTTVTITPTYSAGYEHMDLNVPDGLSQNIKFENGSFKVTVTSNMELTLIGTLSTYNVTVTNPDKGGTATANPASGHKDTVVTLTPTVSDGYRHTGYKVNSGGVTVTGNTFTIGTSDVNITPTFEEIMHDVQIIGGTTDKTEAGISTSGTATVQVPKGYKFVGWEVPTSTSNFAITEGTAKGTADDTQTIKFTATVDGLTVKAKFEEDLSTNYLLFGDWYPDWKESTKFEKESGQSTSNIAYAKVDLTANTSYTFKINISGTNTWYGNNGVIDSTIDFNPWWKFEENKNNCTIKTSIAGKYIFAFDVEQKTVKVFYPSSNTVNFGVSPAKGGTLKAVAEDGAEITSGLPVATNQKVTFTATANAGYDIEGWYSDEACTAKIDGATGNTYEATVESSAINVYVKFKAKTPTVTITSPQQYVVAGEKFTVTATTDDDFAKITSYTFGTETNTDGIFTAPTAAGSYVLSVTAAHNDDANTTGTTTIKINVLNVTRKPIKYYVDMHTDSQPTINFKDGLTVQLNQVNNSTVYSAEFNTAYVVDNEIVKSVLTEIDTITAGGKTLKIKDGKLNNKCITTGEVWIEATKSIDSIVTENTATITPNTTVESTTRRVYWSDKSGNETNALLGTPHAYYWKSEGEYNNINWNTSPKMTKIFGKENDYYIDVPKDAIGIIFKNKADGADNRTVDIELSDSAYAFYPAVDEVNKLYTKDKDNYYYYSNWGDKPADPTPKSYTSVLNMYLDDDPKIIALDLNDNTKVTKYEVANESIATVDAQGNVTPQSVGQTTATITITGSTGDTATVTTTINVAANRPTVPEAYAIMSYQSNTSTFSAVGGKIGTLTTTLAGSQCTGVTTGGIIDGNKVTYAVADPDVPDYAALAVTVTATSSAYDNYTFANWTKNDKTITGATETTLKVVLNTASTDTYVANYNLNSVQMVFTYNFVDYDTSNGYEYKEGGPTKPASYKTAPKQVESSVLTNAEALKDAADNNAPDIVSNYFDYSLDRATVSEATLIDGIYYVTATLQETARKYTVSVDGTEYGQYYFQQECVLDTNLESETGYVWYKYKKEIVDGKEKEVVDYSAPLSDKKGFTLRVANDINLHVKAADGNEKIKNLSIINTAYHEIKTHNNNTYVGQNFYIQNFYRQDDPVYDENGNVVEGATEKTFEGAGILSYNVTTSTGNSLGKPVSSTVRNFDLSKPSLLGVAKRIGVDKTNTSNSIDATSGLNYSFVKASDTTDDITGQTFMKYSQTQGCYSYFYEAMTKQSKLYRNQSYVVYSYYVYSYLDASNVKQYVYVMSDTYATAKVYESK